MKQCFSTQEQRKATEIAIRALWRACGTNPKYIEYHPRKKRINQRVIDAVEKIVLHMAHLRIPSPKIDEPYSADIVLNFLNEEGYRPRGKSKGLSNKS